MQSQPSHSSDITMCTSYHSPETKMEVELNDRLTRQMNPQSQVRWVVGEAFGGETQDRIDRERFTVVAAPTKNDVPPDIGWRSIQHATALNRTLPHIKTRFFVILHPDFYIVRPNWISRVIAHMDESGLAFFGSPVHPRYFDKWRYFPCTQFIVVDLEKISRGDLDFLPGDMKQSKRGYALGSSRGFARMAELWRLFYSRLVGMRSVIGTSRDSGWRIHKKFSARSDIRHECLEPFFRPRRDRGPVDNKLWALNAVIEFFLPERLCFVPKQRRSYSVRGFRDCGYPDAAHYGFEEYLWEGKPFAIHQRGTRAGYSRGIGDGTMFNTHIDQVRKLLDECTDRFNSS